MITDNKAHSLQCVYNFTSGIATFESLLTHKQENTVISIKVKSTWGNVLWDLRMGSRPPGADVYYKS